MYSKPDGVLPGGGRYENAPVDMENDGSLRVEIARPQETVVVQ
jgi:hypothetical protein